MSWKSISLCPKNAPKQTKKPVTQAQMLDMIGFLKADYLTDSGRSFLAFLYSKSTPSNFKSIFFLSKI